MIDDGQEGDGPWNCSTPSVLGLLEVQEYLYLPRINKPTIGFAELPSEGIQDYSIWPLKLKQVFSDVFRNNMHSFYLLCNMFVCTWISGCCGVLPRCSFRTETLIAHPSAPSHPGVIHQKAQGLLLWGLGD